MDWGHVIAIIGSNITLIGVVIGFILWAFNRLDNDIKAQSVNFSSQINELKNDIGKRIDNLDTKIDKVDSRIEPIQHSITDINTRLYGIELVLHMKECCVLKQDQNLKKAE